MNYVATCGSETYKFTAPDNYEARHWAINHLDMSKTWEVKKVEQAGVDINLTRDQLTSIVNALEWQSGQRRRHAHITNDSARAEWLMSQVKTDRTTIDTIEKHLEGVT